MTVTTFHFHSTPTGKPKVMALNAIDVAARYFVYKLYEATEGQPKVWGTLCGMGELRATVERAVERGWVILEGVAATARGGKLLERRAALTDEGRRLARKGR